MAQATIYHNPRCTKSRQAMQVVDELGAEVDVVRYLDDAAGRGDAAGHHRASWRIRPPTSSAASAGRSSASRAADVATADGVVDVLVRHPELMQRPVVVTADRAVIGRPTERVREILGG